MNVTTREVNRVNEDCLYGKYMSELRLKGDTGTVYAGYISRDLKISIGRGML